MNKEGIGKNNYVVFRIIWMLIVIVATGYLFALYRSYLYIPENVRHLEKPLLHLWLKPSGSIGHALGIIGGALMILCYVLYFLRKHIEGFECLGSLAFWLEIHIFFGILGPVLIVFHSALKFRGIIGIGFWLMLMVVISGIFGRIFFGWCFWMITKKYELIHTIDLFIEKDLKDKNFMSPVVKRVMELNSPGFPTINGLIENVNQCRSIKNETNDLFILINEYIITHETYGNTEGEDYQELHKWANQLNKKLREIRYICNLNLILSVLNEWVDIHKVFSYLLFIIMFFHIVATVYWGYSWIFNSLLKI